MHPRFSLSRFIRKQGKRFSSSAAANLGENSPDQSGHCGHRIRWTKVTFSRPVVAIP
jgi:hypothetical protein